MEDPEAGSYVPALDAAERRLAERIVGQIWARWRQIVGTDLKADCLQASAAALWEAREKWRGLPPKERAAYQATCVRHAAVKVLWEELRQRGHSRRAFELSEEEISAAEEERRADWEAILGDDLLARVGREDLYAALQTLPAEERRILSLHIINQLTYREIARRLNKPAGTVQKAGRRAILKLRKQLGVSEGGGPSAG